MGWAGIGAENRAREDLYCIATEPLPHHSLSTPSAEKQGQTRTEAGGAG